MSQQRPLKSVAAPAGVARLMTVNVFACVPTDAPTGLSAGKPYQTAVPRYDRRVTGRRQAEHYVLRRTDRIRAPHRWWCSDWMVRARLDDHFELGRKS
jgi:hypothetical protein